MRPSHDMKRARSDCFSPRHSFFRAARGAVLFTALIGACATASAQTRFGALTGVVKDPANVALAGATVTAAQQDGGTVRGTISNSEGIYSFSDLPPGAYSVIAQTQGYAEVAVSSLNVTSGRATRAD